MFNRLYDFAFQFKEYLALAVCGTASIFLLTFNDNPQIRSIRTIAVASVGFLQDVFDIVPNYVDLRAENRALRELNVTLADEVNRLREARLENIRLRGMIGLNERPRPSHLPANVVGKNLQLLRNTITLDVGQREGVRVNMPVVTGSGLVGKVTTASIRYAIAQILLNKDLRVSAKVQRSRVDGIVRWEGGGRLRLSNVAKTLDVLPGDVVVTSEYSSIYPAGIRIGVVTDTHPVEGSLFQSIEIAPDVDFNRLEEVFVLLASPDSSRLVLEGRTPE
jgi:rod shape-determining protein MreC